MTELVDRFIKLCSIAALVAVVAIVTYVVWSMYHKSSDKVYHFRCPSCHHKLRGLSHQVGHKGMCNNCREMFTFPPPPGTAA
jgi:hypothetical protein